MLTRLKTVTLILSMLFMTVAYGDSPSCDRNLYPKGKTLDLSTIDEVAASSESCKNMGVAIQCINDKTKVVVCFKCRNNKKWTHLKDTIYTCTD